MLDWFDPGFTHEDFRGMGKTPEQYAHSRLDPTPSAAVSYKAAQRGAVRMTILSPGMRHTAFTDDLWSSASTEAERGRFAEYLKQVRTATRLFFERSLNGDYRELCALRIPQIHIVCFQSPAR